MNGHFMRKMLKNPTATYISEYFCSHEWHKSITHTRITVHCNNQKQNLYSGLPFHVSSVLYQLCIRELKSYGKSSQFNLYCGSGAVNN